MSLVSSFKFYLSHTRLYRDCITSSEMRVGSLLTLFNAFNFTFNASFLNKSINFLNFWMVAYQGFHKHMKQSKLFLTLIIIIIITVSWAANQHIRIISEGSWNTEDWSNDAENSALHHMNKLHFTIYSHRKHSFEIVIIFHRITVFDQKPWRAEETSFNNNKKKYSKFSTSSAYIIYTCLFGQPCSCFLFC